MERYDFNVSSCGVFLMEAYEQERIVEMRKYIIIMTILMLQTNQSN